MKKRNFLGFLMVLALLGCGFALEAHAAGNVTICERFGGYLDPGTLGYVLVGGGDITFQCSGTIIVTPQINIQADTRINANGYEVALNGNNANSVFWVSANNKLDLIGLTITGGAIFGGVRNLGGTVTMESCVISGNTSMSGGGIRNENTTSSVGTVILTNTTVYDNNAYSESSNASGAGIYNAGNMTLTDSTVTGNSATTLTGNATCGGIYNVRNSTLLGAGSMTLVNTSVSYNTAPNNGGILNQGDLTLLDSTVEWNSATAGDAGAIMNYSNLIISNSILSDNTATNRGGGIYSYGGSIIIENSTVSNNHSDNVGGGIQTVVSATLTVTNSTISANSATQRGGGIESFGGQVTITNSTLSGNSANQGGGIYNYAPLSLNHVTLFGNSASEGNSLYIVNNPRAATQMTNTLIADGATLANCSGNPGLIIDGGYNLADDNSCNLVNGTSLPSTDPLLDAALADNGGFTYTHALLANSLAIDQIPSGVNGCGNTITTDQRGISRPQGDGCDIGAYELEFIIDIEPPFVSQVQTFPNPAQANTAVTLTATVDDITTGNSTIVSAEYNVDGGNWVSMSAVNGAYDTPTEAVTATLMFTTEYGTHTICVRGTDELGNTSSGTACISVIVEPDTNAVHVEAISGTIKTSRKSSSLTATVQVLDNNSAPIQGVVVYADFTNPAVEGVVTTLKARTGRSGVATFKATSTIPSWQVCVTNISKTGYVWDSSADKETCEVFSNYLPTNQTKD